MNRSKTAPISLDYPACPASLDTLKVSVPPAVKLAAAGTGGQRLLPTSSPPRSPVPKHHRCIYTHDDWNRRWKSRRRDSSQRAKPLLTTNPPEIRVCSRQLNPI